MPLPNVGREKAETAAAVGGIAVLPSFKPGDNGSDWNDLARQEGHASVIAAVHGALEGLRPTREVERVRVTAVTAQREQRTQRMRQNELRLG